MTLPTACAATVRTLQEWEACKEGAVDGAVLLQMGSPVCALCPAFSARIEELKKERKFRHVYVNMHDAEEDLCEELQVTRLPAYVLVSGDQTLSTEGATPDQLAQTVHSVCDGVLVLDDDF